MRRIAVVVFVLILLIGAFTNLRNGATTVDHSSIKISIIKENGGRVEWSPVNNLIVFDKKNEDGYFDVYVMNPDGTNETCLTCGNKDLPRRNMGNPTWHPSGKYIVIQVEKAEHPQIENYFTTPGVGFYNDLWVITCDGSKTWQLTNLTTANLTGVLHPHFSHSGSQLIWSETLHSQEMAIKIADFVVEENSVYLENITTYQPGEKHVFYEAHGFSPDDSKIIFSASIDSEHWTGMDIYTLDLETIELMRLTNTSDEWDEHAHYSPDGKKIVWVSSHGYPFDPDRFTRELRLELWMMNADGSNKTRLTYLNEPGYPEYTGFKTGVGDNCWSPDGKKILFKLRESHGLISKEKIALLEFIEKPEVYITKPSYGLYISDKQIFPLRNNAVIVGKITVEAEPYGNISKVEFYINDELKAVDFDKPYEWLWDETVFGKHEIKVVAYDNEGNEAEDEMNVFIINILANGIWKHE